MSTVLIPISWPPANASSQGKPSDHINGAIIQPKIRCKLKGAPWISGSTCRILLQSVTSETNTSNMAMMFKNSFKPSSVPLLMASIELLALEPSSTGACSLFCQGGIIIIANRIAAGALISDATSTCPNALSMTSPRMMA